MSNTIDTFQNFYLPNLSNRKFFIKDCVKEVRNIVDATFSFDNIQVIVNDEENEKIDANLNEISQVIFSIINNAREILVIKNIAFPRIEITIKNREIIISDNGGGIDEKVLPKIFSSFFSTKSSSGIGLYLSKKIIEKNGADLQVCNKESGASFKIIF